MSNPTEPTDPSDPSAYSGYGDPAAAPPGPAAPGPAAGYAPPPAGATPYATPQPAYAAPQPGYAAPPPVVSPSGSPILTTIGDISLTQFEVITPLGAHPLNGTTWYITDNTTYEETTPQWALILAIVGFFVVCILSLLFLLVKEKKASGSVVITVQGPGWSHAAHLPPGTGAHAQTQVEYARTLVAALPA